MQREKTYPNMKGPRAFVFSFVLTGLMSGVASGRDAATARPAIKADKNTVPGPNEDCIRVLKGKLVDLAIGTSKQRPPSAWGPEVEV
jgi:hypothetical protein